MFRRVSAVAGWSAFVAVGCAGPRVVLPQGYLPAATVALDVGTSETLTRVAPPPASGPPKSSGFDLPRTLPGSDAPAPKLPRFEPNATAADRDKAVAKAYPELTPVSAAATLGEPVPLADLQQRALANSPVIKRANADVEAAFGQVLQAGLYPNPTVGYQADQWQPNLRIPPGATFSGNGQQGGFINQLIKTAGKLSLAQRVAGYDYVNALVAVRKAHVNVTAAVRTHYFAALVAQRGVEIYKGLADLSDEVYRMQLKQVAVGEAAGYEPLPLYAQSVQARNAVVQAEATARAAWAQLAAAVGEPDLPLSPVAGGAEAAAPKLSFDELRRRIGEQHTDLLTDRNAIAQASANLELQRKLPIPDIQTNQYHQYDNNAQVYQFGVQIGIALPLTDRNQGNVRSAVAKIASARQALVIDEQALGAKLAEAFTRYESNVKIADDIRGKVLPSLTTAYRAMVRRWNVDEPGKVSFNDLVVAQQNVAQALQSYLTALNGQWQAVVDVANVAQLDDLYDSIPTPRIPGPTP